MCDHLQRMNDSLNEAYTNNIREKDRRIADLGIYWGDDIKTLKSYADENVKGMLILTQYT